MIQLIPKPRPWNEGEKSPLNEENLLLHLDTVFHERVNFFLVAQSILFAAISQMWINQGHKLFKIGLCLLGIAYTVMIAMAIINLAAHRERLMKKLYDDVAAVEKPSWWPQVTDLFRFWLPSITLLIWLVLLAKLVFWTA